MIKLTLDETIQEQSSLLDGSAIHNRLKYLGILDKPTISTNTFNIDKTYYSKNLDYDSKYKLLDDERYKYLEYDIHPKIKPHKKSANLIMNDMYLTNPYNNYNSNFKSQAYDLSSTIYDDHHNDSYNLPMHFQKYGKTMNFQTPYPREHRVYCFPTSKPLAQYPRQITEQFYRQKPVKQYPEEELSFWQTRHPKPVRVIEREPFYATVDYGYHNNFNPNDYHVGNKNIEPYYTPEYRAKHFPTNYTIYNDYNNSNYYHEPDLGQRSFSSITRPCSPVYTRDNLYDTNYLKNTGSLLEKKIRDYVWKPHKEHVEKYSHPNYDNSTYTNFEPLKNINRYEDDQINRTHSSLGLNYQRRRLKREVIDENIENPYKKNSIITSPGRRLSKNENVQIPKDDDNFFKNTSNEKKPENSVHLLKQISFDLGNEDSSDHTNYIRENANTNSAPNENKLILGKRESSTKLNDKRRTSLLSKDSNTSINKQHSIPSSINNEHFRKESVSKQGKLISNRNSFQPDTYLNLKNNSQENDLNSINNNTPDYNNDNKIIDSNDNNVTQNMSNGSINREIRRDSNDIGRRKLSETTNKLNSDYSSHSESIPNKKNNSHLIKRNDSFKDDLQKYTNENIPNSIKSFNKVDNQLSKECINYQNIDNLNELPINDINLSVVDHNDINHNDVHNLNNFNTNDQKLDYSEQYINNDNAENKNNSEMIQRYQVDSSNEETNRYSIEQDSTDFTIIPNDQEPSRKNVINEYTDDKNYFQNHQDENKNENLTHERVMPEYLDGQNDNYDNNYYTNNHHTNVKEEIPTRDQDDGSIQRDEFNDEKRMQNEYYYQNPTDDTKENITENQYENPGHQENADDYYYQNYSNDASKEQLENQYDESNHQREYVNEHNPGNNYYYQDHEEPLHPDALEQNGDQQYVDSNYHHVDDYYQNYSDVDPNAQQKNKYIDSSHQGNYMTEHNVEHNDYYYQNHPETTTNENQIDQNYIESEQDGGNYIDGVQDNNYYYENNSNANPNRLPPVQLYDGNVEQENYVDDQHHVNEDYYYQKQDENNYDTSIPKNQYDGYGDDQHAPNNSYYPEADPNDYEQKYNINYENDNYQTQQSEYIEPVYEQNPNNENYNNYSDNVADVNRITNELPIKIQNDSKKDEN